MKDKLVLITGANRGIGFCITRQLAQMGARIVMACRDLPNANSACESLQEEIHQAQIEVMRLDLASLKSIHTFNQQFHARFSSLDILINNAGVFSMKREETIDGFEKTIGTNYLGPFLLTHLLRSILEKTPEAKIINLSSNAHYYAKLNLDDFHLRRRYHGFQAYAASKLAIVFFSQELAKRVKPSGVSVISAHPGHVATHMWEIWPDRKMLQAVVEWLLKHIMISPQEGANSVVQLATLRDLATFNGRYFSDGKLREPSRRCRDLGMQKDLWQLSEVLTGILG
jgi:NAD(P)-dependent dehydrogenase (short-subunit alcohol dehydrogenase family)